MPLAIRAAAERDVHAISRLDATYQAGRRVLALSRSGDSPEVTLTFAWREGTPREETYGEYTEDRLRRALAKTDLFLIAEEDGAICGMLMVIVPSWTDAGEITDLVVDRRCRRGGAGRALVEAAVSWAKERSLRALWVEPRADNSEAIDFYGALGFRLSGFNDRMYANTDGAPGRPTIYMYLELA